MQYVLNDEKATLDFGIRLAKVLADDGLIVYLQGDLGVGKTTLMRGLLRALGYRGNVKSPTYTLVEEYAIAHRTIYHFDLYRLEDPEELAYIGINDYFEHHCYCFIEWPERGIGVLPEADLLCKMQIQQNGRLLILEAMSQRGQQVLANLAMA